MTKVNIISGFLGAGKTTLIKKLLDGAFEGEKVVLLENEYGEVGIDGGFMKDTGIQVTEINSGCICCTLVGDFSEALIKMIDAYHPDRILIEPSGVGKLSDIRKVVCDVAAEHPELELAGCATVADVSKCRMYAKNFGEFFLDQIQSAETILLSRTQFASQDRIDKAVALLREHNARARIVTTPWDELDACKILETIEKPDFLLSIEDLFKDEDEDEDECGHHHDHDDDDEHEHHHECYHHHDHDDDDDEHEHHHECCHHHDHDDDDDEHEHHHECCHHHDHDGDDDEHEHHHECCHHHDHDGDDDEHEHHHECCHHHDDDDDEHEHHHECGCGHHHHHDHECGCGHHHHGHDADEVFENIGVETPKKFEEKDVRAALEQLEDEKRFGAILRAKGILPLTNGKWIHFDYVPGESDVRYGAADYTGRLCVIGTKINEDALRKLFGI